MARQCYLHVQNYLLLSDTKTGYSSLKQREST